MCDKCIEGDDQREPDDQRIEGDDQREPDEPDSVKCADCGEFHDCDWENSDGSAICETCFRENYTSCYHCDAILSSMDSACIDDNDVCPSCVDRHYFDCSQCGEMHHLHELIRTESGEGICDACYMDHFFTCEDCNEVFHIDDNAGDCYCESCHDHREEEEEARNGPILEYSDRAANFLGPFGEGPTRFGVELEVECVEGRRGDAASAFLERIGYDFAVCKNDGSLSNGFEVVTGPSDVKTHSKRWFDALGSHRPRGLRSWDTTTCGMHVHVSRDGLTPLTIGKLLVFLNEPDNYGFIKTIAGRDSSRWAKVSKKKITDCLNDRYQERYSALNLQNRHTIEFRIFRGTLIYATIMKNLEFCHASVEFSKQAGIKENHFSSFLAFIERTPTRWPHLTAFLRHKNLLKRPLVKPGEQAPLPTPEQ